MTFDNGSNTSQPAAQWTEQAVRLIVQGVITLAIMGAWVWAITGGTGNTATIEILSPIVVTLMGFWFGSGALAVYAEVKRSQARVDEIKMQYQIERIRVKSNE